MPDEEFFSFLDELLAAIPERQLDDAHYERAIGYPWERPPGSCLVTDEGVEELAGIDPGRRREIVDRYLDPAAGRVPLLAYGANGSPERLALKLAHLPEEHREALIVAGHLDDYDIGAAAQAPFFSSMPATPIPSAGTSVRVAVLFLTSIQFTALWWTELNYKVGALTDVRLVTDVTDEPIRRVILFVSRYGAFCVDGAPVAMDALPARNRRSQALTQIEILEAAARMTIGARATARDLIKHAFEDPARFWARHRSSFQAVSAPFACERWAEMPAA